MNKMLLISVLALVVTGCESASIESMGCPGANGKDVKIRYGDSKIDVTHKVKVKPDGKIVLKLEPDNQSDEGVDYQELDIELIGKDEQSQWLNLTLNANDNNTPKAVICVDGRPEGTYYYRVVVPGVGEIDPRADVEM